MNCRHCGVFLTNTFLDLGFAPPSNAYLTNEDLNKPEKYYPLNIKVCDQCWLVQTEDYAQADELFSPDYAYFSSTSSGWLDHAKRYSQQMTEMLNLNSDSYVIEIASNDGYLLKNFVEAGIPCLGVEPTDSTADAAEKIDIPVLREFFGEKLGERLAQEGKQGDLIVGNNVYAHVPDINDFTKGLRAALKPEGVITLEFPHLMQLIKHTQFDTIYHEHFSYLSLYTAIQIFNAAGCHQEDKRATTESVDVVLKQEKAEGLQTLDTYTTFQNRANQVKNGVLQFLIEQKQAGKKVAAYGAAAKGNTLLNYAGVKSDLLPFVCDAAEAKQGKFMPGSHIPILSPEVIEQQSPDFVLILPWNIANEVMKQNSVVRDWGGKFVTAVPELKIK
jgi:SAM-dependent methyltransferase